MLLPTRHLSLVALLVGIPPLAPGQTFSPEEYLLSNHRMGAFQCLRCPKGGFLEGIRSGDNVRIRREFSAIQQLCVGRYSYESGKQYIYFQLDGGGWPDKGAWGLKSSSWNAECHLK